MVTGVGMDELAPLLAHLSTNRKRISLLGNIPIPPSRKLEYNRFGEDMADFLRLSLPHVPLIKDYYGGLADPLERDEVAAAFRQEYLGLVDTLEDPDAIVVRLQWYILGNEARSPKDQIETNIVLITSSVSARSSRCRRRTGPLPTRPWKGERRDRTDQGHRTAAGAAHSGGPDPLGE